MARQRREIPAEVREDLAAQRDAGASYVADAPTGDDPLHALAFLAGVEDEVGRAVDQAVKAARDDRYQWREISEASGHGDSPEAADAAQMRHRRRN